MKMVLPGPLLAIQKLPAKQPLPALHTCGSCVMAGMSNAICMTSHLSWTAAAVIALLLEKKEEVLEVTRKLDTTLHKKAGCCNEGCC